MVLTAVADVPVITKAPAANARAPPLAYPAVTASICAGPRATGSALAAGIAPYRIASAQSGYIIWLVRIMFFSLSVWCISGTYAPCKAQGTGAYLFIHLRH